MKETYVSPAALRTDTLLLRRFEWNPKTNQVVRLHKDLNRSVYIVERGFFGVNVEDDRDVRIEFDTCEEWAARAQYIAFCREIGV